MTSLTCYRLAHPKNSVRTFDNFVDPDELSQLDTEDTTEANFEARLYVRPVEAREPGWASLLSNAFPASDVGTGQSPSALLLVRLTGPSTRTAQGVGGYFAFTFGPAGRFLVRRECIVRGYGLRAALNMIYPKGGDDRSRLRAIDSKRRGPTVVRARAQASTQTNLEMFDVNQLRDVLDKATGTPSDAAWGSAVSGADAFSFNVDLEFADLGDRCRALDRMFARLDYQERFAWIDDIRPVTDTALIEQLEDVVIQQLLQDPERAHLGPPEVLDWDHVAGFTYMIGREPTDGRPRFSDLRLTDYLKLVSTESSGSLTGAKLRRSMVVAVSPSGDVVAKWSIWRCLVAELKHSKQLYLLEEGEFFAVSEDYVADLDGFVDSIPDAVVQLPGTRTGTTEGDYNELAAKGDKDLLLLDKKTVRIPKKTTAIEICDLLSTSGDLVHVKRHLGSSTLSHLFAQGLVSAELLQSSVEFREVAISEITATAGKRTGFDLFTSDHFAPNEFEVVYAIAEEWGTKTMAEALPFFSKVNLREAAINLRARGFRVSLKRIDAQP